MNSPTPCPLGDFPLLQCYPELAYWDNAATTQKPRCLIDSLAAFYREHNAPIHRAAYHLAADTSSLYEKTRRRVADFCGWPHHNGVVFTHGCTSAINLVARQFLAPRLQKSQKVLLSVAEHHANFIPWQQVCREQGACFRVLPLDANGELSLDLLEEELQQDCAMLAVCHVSNVLGVMNPIAKIAKLAKRYRVPLLIDGAQASGHLPLRLHEVDCDFYCFSSHKMYAADGCGVLLAKVEHLQEMAPLITGGGIVDSVSCERTVYIDPPQRFEAGTMPVASIVTLSTVLDYLEEIGLAKIAAHECNLARQAVAILSEEPALKIYGNRGQDSGLISFAIAGAHPHDIATIFDDFGLAVRAGHHCAQPLMQFLAVNSLVRISFAMYSQEKELQRLLPALQAVRRILL